MRYFLENFEAVYKNDWPFGAFPDWEHYPSTGTHIGTDFKVSTGTPVYAPVDGELFKVEYNQHKGNVAIYIFNYNNVEWALEFCHLRELPQKGSYKEGDVIAHSGNTGDATTGAHLHAVLHRDAAVTKHYQQLLASKDRDVNRQTFLRLEAEGAIVDCFPWFCKAVKEETSKGLEAIPPEPTAPDKQPDPRPVEARPTLVTHSDALAVAIGKAIEAIVAFFTNLRRR